MSIELFIPKNEFDNFVNELCESDEKERDIFDCDRALLTEVLYQVDDVITFIVEGCGVFNLKVVLRNHTPEKARWAITLKIVHETSDQMDPCALASYLKTKWKLWSCFDR